MSKTNKIDIESEVVRDYLEQIPNGLIRWGSFVICSVLLALFLITCFLQYPSIVRAEFKLKAFVTPKPVIARIDGRLEKIFVTDNQKVVANQVLGYIESTTKYDEVIQLDKELDDLSKFIEVNDLINLNQVHLKDYHNLGEIQASYQNFQQAYIQTLILFSNGYYKKNQKFLKVDIEDLSSLLQNLKDQKQVLYQDLKLQEKEYGMNKTLHKNNVIADVDLYRQESKLLSKKEPLAELETTLITNTILIRTKEKEILDLIKLATLQEETFQQSLNTLRSVIAEWKKRYVFYAPTRGVVNFTSFLQEKESLKINTEIMYVSSPKNKYKGEVKIPQDNFGKVKVGQIVLVKFKGYPYEEYGIIEGKIESIAKIPSDNGASFYANITLLNDEKTTNGKILNFRNGMLASAEIVTENMTLAQRIFYSFRKKTNL
ncbi:HlyD family secretion protein [Flavobacterium sp. AJR]|uniref:HlyD family secretion protein n=1 Tax=Flavobacterium sp. AJR TaxID=1979369 RepID=UPI000A3D7B85|nr:HlyD family efflux transporter periplasmic adaptor subunit [Flavobacterium sp. AJR]OUL60624.1 hypothetical protein B8T70_19375 [Flavobacterium sp. AJR]